MVSSHREKGFRLTQTVPSILHFSGFLDMPLGTVSVPVLSSYPRPWEEQLGYHIHFTPSKDVSSQAVKNIKSKRSRCSRAGDPVVTGVGRVVDAQTHSVCPFAQSASSSLLRPGEFYRDPGFLFGII